MTHLGELRTAFDREVSRADHAEALAEGFRAQLFEEQTANSEKKSLIEVNERELAEIRGQYIEQQSLIDGLQEVIGPVSAMLSKFSRNKASGDKHEREEGGSDQEGRNGSSTRARH